MLKYVVLVPSRILSVRLGLGLLIQHRPRTNYLGEPKNQDTRSHPPGINLWYDGSALASLCLGKDATKFGHLIECLLARRLQSHSARQKHIQGFYG